MMRRHWKSLIASVISFCAAIVFVLIVCPPCRGQTSDATLGGVVEDRSGAVLPNVQIKVTNVETGVTRNTTTNGSGLFYVPGLNPGKYAVHVEHPGFADVEVTKQPPVGDQASSWQIRADRHS
jgi:Carboxypeptidase regulatory-like domain